MSRTILPVASGERVTSTHSDGGHGEMARIGGACSLNILSLDVASLNF